MVKCPIDEKKKSIRTFAWTSFLNTWSPFYFRAYRLTNLFVIAALPSLVSAWLIFKYIKAGLSDQKLFAGLTFKVFHATVLVVFTCESAPVKLDNICKKFCISILYRDELMSTDEVELLVPSAPDSSKSSNNCEKQLVALA